MQLSTIDCAMLHLAGKGHWELFDDCYKYFLDDEEDTFFSWPAVTKEHARCMVEAFHDTLTLLAEGNNDVPQEEYDGMPKTPIELSLLERAGEGFWKARETEAVFMMPRKLTRFHLPCDDPERTIAKLRKDAINVENGTRDMPTGLGSLPLNPVMQ